MKDILRFFQLAIILCLAAGFLFIGVTLHTAYEEGRIFAPDSPKTDQQIQQEEQQAATWYYLKTGFFVVALLAGFGATLRFLLVPALNAIGEFNMAENGLWKPKRVVTSPLLERLNPFVETKAAVYDINEQHLPVIETRSNGRLEVVGGTGGMSIEAQERLAAALIRAQVMYPTMRAATAGGRPPTQAVLRGAAGEFEARAQRERWRVRQAELDTERKQQRLVLSDLERFEAAEEQMALPSITPGQAADYMQAHPGEVVVGQAVETGQLGIWRPQMESVLGIFGANGTGKTSNAAAACVTGMLVWRWHVVIFEPEYKSDWTGYGTLVERHPTAAHVALAHLEGVYEEFWRRAELAKQYAAQHLDDLPAAVQPHKLGIVFEEFGKLVTDVQATGTMAQFEKIVSDLCSMGRYLNMHFVFIDQRPAAYPKRMLGNFKQIITYQLKMGQGGVVQEPFAHTLPPRGEFYMDTVRYRSLHMLPLASRLRAHMQPYLDAPLMQPIAVSSFGSRAEEGGEVPPGSHHPSPQNGRVNRELPVGQRSSRAQDRPPGEFTPSAWREPAMNWLNAHREARLIDLARWMAKQTGKPVDHMKSNAKKFYDEWRQQTHQVWY